MKNTSLRRYLLLGILLPISIFLVIDTVSLYRQTLEALNTAYDRTLLASAKTIGEQLEVLGSGEQAYVRATVPFSALEAFEADNRSQMFYRVTGFKGEVVSGFDDLPSQPDERRMQANPYAALVNFYDDQFRGRAVRVAVLHQPVASAQANGMAIVQVAETLELREALARQILLDTLLRQLVLVAVIGLVVALVVQRATRPVRDLSAQIEARAEHELQPLDGSQAPRELRPLIDATNHALQRVANLLEHQKRFVRDAAHQLRTPLAVLKTQLQSAQRGDVPPATAYAEIAQTTERATDLANQMLSLAKVEQLRHQADTQALDWSEAVRAVALDVAPLVADKELDFELQAAPAKVRAHEWMLRELTRNLLYNAVAHCPRGGALQVLLTQDPHQALLTIADSGPGIAPGDQARVFEPFASGAGTHTGHSGSGLGLAIVKEIVTALGGTVALENRMRGAQVLGLNAVVRLPLSSPLGMPLAGGAQT